ncbi:hypothetical protein, partial [Kitasatospora sp. NPDC004272]
MEQQRNGEQPPARHRRPLVGRRRMLTWLAVGTVTALGGGVVLRQSRAGADEPAARPAPGGGSGSPA